MALSPNYGWAEPDDSAFVKNGAQAMRTLGDAVDASLNQLAQFQSNIPHPFLLMGA